MFGLHRRTEHRAVGTEHTAIALLWPQLFAATRAVVEELARVSWHDFRFLRTAVRTGDDRLKDHGFL